MNMKKILEDIKTNTYERFYLFYGEEKYMISQMKNQLKKALVSEDDTMNYSYFEGKRADAIEIVELAKTLPFFSDHRFLILDETGLGKKSDDTFIEGLKEASDTSVVLIIEDSVDKRSKIYIFLSKEGHAVCFESAGDKELSRWLASLLKKEGKQMSSATMRSFLYRCGSDMYTLKNTIFRRDEIWFAAENASHESEIYSLHEIRGEDNDRVKNTAAYDKQYLEGRYGADPYLSNMLGGDFA